MTKYIMIAAIAFALAGCKSKDTTEDNNLEGQTTEATMDNSDGTTNADGTTSTSDTTAGPASYNAGTSYPGDTAKK